jgi:hypothetical protein
VSSTLTRRQWMLGLVLCITLAATLWVSQGEEEAGQGADVSDAATPGHARQPPRREAAADSTPLLQLGRLARRAPADLNQDAFAGRSWVAPPPPVVQAPPAAPSAPPLPFTYIGKMQEGETGPVTVHLVQGEQSYSVKQGDVIDKTYRVESIDAAQIVLTYLPLAIKQTLTFGSS